MICIARQCMKYSFCPLHSTEKDYRKWLKRQKAKQAKIEKEEDLDADNHSDQDNDNTDSLNINSTKNSLDT